MSRPEFTSRQRIVYDLVAAAALKGQPCPTNETILARLKPCATDAPAHTLGELEELGHIAIERGPRWRVVTIVATGAVTARPFGAPPAPEDRMPATIGRPELAPGERRRAYSDSVTASPVLTRAADRGDRAAVRHPAPIAPPPPTPVADPPSPVAPTPPPCLEEEPPVSQTITHSPLAGPTITRELPSAAADDRADAAAQVVTMPATPALSADVAFSDGELKLTIYLSTDPGPMREFRPFIIVPLDDMRALELLGTASIALRDWRAAQVAA